MGRELQKRKNRSSRSLVRHKPRNKAKGVRGTILGNALIAERWDKSKTIGENYAALGLARRLGGRPGGSAAGGIKRPQDPFASAAAKSSRGVAGKAKTGAEAPFAVTKASYEASLARLEAREQRETDDDDGQEDAEAVAEVRVERDPATGAILRVLTEPAAGSAAGAAGTKRSKTRDNGRTGWTGRAKLPQDRLRALDSDSDSDSEPGSDMDRNASASAGADAHSDPGSDSGPDWDAEQEHAQPRGRGRGRSTTDFLARLHQNTAATAARARANRAQTEQRKGLTEASQAQEQEQEQEHPLDAALAEAAANAAPPKLRTQSGREQAWLQSLIAQHGAHAYDAMARDRALNVRQQTAGDIRRRVRKYLASTSMPAEQLAA